jgi:hypothetical protein
MEALDWTLTGWPLVGYLLGAGAVLALLLGWASADQRREARRSEALRARIRAYTN